MDMLIRLHGPLPLPAVIPGTTVRKPIGPELDLVVRWVESSFIPPWASEARAALANRPRSLFIAKDATGLTGFACYDATARGFVGPIGVTPSARGRGIGAALLHACLHDMRTLGYGYAVAGHVGEPGFFRHVAHAIEIPDSTPGFYADMLK